MRSSYRKFWIAPTWGVRPFICILGKRRNCWLAVFTTYCAQFIRRNCQTQENHTSGSSDSACLSSSTFMFTGTRAPPGWVSADEPSFTNIFKELSRNLSLMTSEESFKADKEQRTECK